MKNISNENILREYIVKYVIANSCHNFLNEVTEKKNKKPKFINIVPNTFFF